MAVNENLIPIPGRLHSVATEGHVAGADEIYDDTLQKDQATINQEVNAALGEGGTVDEKIEEAIDNALEDVAFIDDSESSPAVVPGFDPTTDTVHVTAQTLSEQQKAQVRNNIGLGDVDARISNAVASEASQRAAADSSLQSSISAEATARANAVSAETSRAQAAESALQNNIEALTQSNIVVVADHTSVSSPDPLTIYREQGTNTYSDWMYQNGSWMKMAEYDNAIDDEPTVGSNNLVKSGGVTSALFELYKNGIIFEGDAQESFFDNVFEKGVTYTVTSLNSISCSFAFKDANENVIEVHYLEPNQSYTFTFNIPNCETFGGYTSGDAHYKLRIKVSSFQELNSNIDRIIQDSFEKGNINEYGKNNIYKELSRARSLGIRNSGNVSISIKTLQQVSQTASFIVFYYNAKGTYLNNGGWKKEAIIPAHSYYRFLLSLDPSASEEHTDSLSAILSAFSINPVDDGIEVLSNNWKSLFIRGTSGQDGAVSADWMDKSRVCTAKKIKTDKDIFVRYKRGYYDLRLWSSDGSTLLYEKNWWDGEVTNDNFIPAGSVFTMNITPDREAGQNDYYTLDEIFACIGLEDALCHNCVSIPKTILQCRNVDDSRFPPYTKYYIQAAVKNQYDRVRVNIRKTTDGVFWCCHDDTINAEARNSDGSQISETIQANGHTYAELSVYDWGIKYGPLYAGLTPPKFEDVCKFSSYFNIPLTIETSIDMSEQDINTMFTLLETYGLVKDLIIITSTGSNWSEMNIWKQKSKYISFFVGGTYAQLSSWINTINSYKTGYNNIFIMIYPFGEHADSNLRTLCSNNDWLIYDSAIMSKWDLMTYGFNRGISLLEANNVYMVKTNIQNIADNNI